MITDNLRSEVDTMCSFSLGIKEEYLNKGKIEGKIETFANCTINLMNSMHITLEQAMDRLGISEDIKPLVLEEIAKLTKE